MKCLEVLMMKEDKALKEEVQYFYLNGGTYKEEEIDFGKSQGKEYSDWVIMIIKISPLIFKG